MTGGAARGQGGKARRALRKAGKIAAMGLALVLLVAGAWVAAHWDEVADIPRLPSAYEAKEMCSCLFVEGHPQEFCERFVRQDTLPIQGRTVDTAQRTVTVRALWLSSRARHVSGDFGCVLDPPR